MRREQYISIAAFMFHKLFLPSEKTTDMNTSCSTCKMLDLTKKNEAQMWQMAYEWCTLHILICLMSLYLYLYIPVSWPTWEKVYCSPSANWKASIFPILYCTLASTINFVNLRISLHTKQCVKRCIFWHNLTLSVSDWNSNDKKHNIIHELWAIPKWLELAPHVHTVS